MTLIFEKKCVKEIQLCHFLASLKVGTKMHFPFALTLHQTFGFIATFLWKSDFSGWKKQNSFSLKKYFSQFLTLQTKNGFLVKFFQEMRIKIYPVSCAYIYRWFISRCLTMNFFFFFKFIISVLLIKVLKTTFSLMNKILKWFWRVKNIYLNIK